MVGLRQVDQLEVEGEGARKQGGALDGQRVHQLQCDGSMASGFFLTAAGLGIAPANGALAQRFNVVKQIFSGLFAQYLAEQRAERANIAAQRSLFQVAGLRFEFGEALRPALGIPQKGHRDLIMHDGR